MNNNNTPKFFRLDSSTFVNLSHVTHVWYEEPTKFREIKYSLTGDVNVYTIDNIGRIQEFLRDLNISFDHDFF